MSASRFKTQFNPKYKGDPGRIMDSKSDTVPNDCISLQDLLKNHTRGIPLQVASKMPLYFENVVHHQITDLNDIKELREALKTRERELKAQAKSEIQEAAEKRDKAKESAPDTKTDVAEGDTA